MLDSTTVEETCENCRYLADDDTCANSSSVYHGRPTVYRDGAEVLQTGWCEHWSPAVGENDV